MEDFDILEQVIKNSRGLTEKIDVVKIDDCSHCNITTDKNNTVCTDCGEEISISSPFDKEWRFYGSNDNRLSSDPNRCQIRKNGERSIYKDVEGLNFSDNIVSLANDLYMEITEGGIHRGAKRKGIIFACIQQAYSLNGKPQTIETLTSIFGLEKKAALSGIKHVNTKASVKFRQNKCNVTPDILLEKIMKIFDANSQQIKEVKDLYPLVKDKSVTLNGCRTWSLTSGLVYYWIVKNDKKIPLKDFAVKVQLSALTITKMFKEIDRVLIRLKERDEIVGRNSTVILPLAVK